jgi:hypothetical protein
MKRLIFTLTVATLALFAAEPAMAQWARIIEIKHVTQDSTASVADVQHVWLLPQGDRAERFGAREDYQFSHTDELGLALPWATKLGIDLGRQRGGRSEGRAVVARAFLDSRGNKVLRGTADNRDGAAYRFERFNNGRTRVEVLSGAMVLHEWPQVRNQTVCIFATGACARTVGTDYAIEVDDTQRSRLVVESGEVEIDWTNPQDSSSVVVLARPGTVWTWTVTEPPEEEDNDDEVMALIQDALEHYGDDIWGKSFFETPWPYVIGGGIIACAIWCFGDDDATGTVTIIP